MANHGNLQNSVADAAQGVNATTADGEQQAALKQLENQLEQPPQPLPISYVVHRFVINSASWWTWLPYIVLLASQDANLGGALIFGTSFSCLCVLFNTIMLIFHKKKEPPYLLDISFSIFFIVYTAVYFQKIAFDAMMEKWLLVVLHGWISSCILLSMLVRYPFTLQHAKEAAPEEAWTSSVLRSVAYQLAGVWLLAMITNCALCLIPALKNQHKGRRALNIIFNYVWPYVTLFLLFTSTFWWPPFIRRTCYIPRMLNNSVKPELETGTDLASKKEQTTENAEPELGSQVNKDAQGYPIGLHQQAAAMQQSNPGNASALLSKQQQARQVEGLVGDFIGTAPDVSTMPPSPASPSLTTYNNNHEAAVFSQQQQQPAAAPGGKNAMMATLHTQGNAAGVQGQGFVNSQQGNQAHGDALVQQRQYGLQQGLSPGTSPTPVQQQQQQFGLQQELAPSKTNQTQYGLQGEVTAAAVAQKSEARPMMPAGRQQHQQQQEYGLLSESL